VSHRGGAVPHAVGVTAVAGGVVTDTAEATAVAVSAPRIASARPAISVKGVVLRRGYPVPGVTWRDPSTFT
jgi:hypothetical protein